MIAWTVFFHSSASVYQVPCKNDDDQAAPRWYKSVLKREFRRKVSAPWAIFHLSRLGGPRVEVEIKKDGAGTDWRNLLDRTGTLETPRTSIHCGTCCSASRSLRLWRIFDFVCLSSGLKRPSRYGCARPLVVELRKEVDLKFMAKLIVGEPN